MIWILLNGFINLGLPDNIRATICEVVSSNRQDIFTTMGKDHTQRLDGNFVSTILILEDKEPDLAKALADKLNQFAYVTVLPVSYFRPLTPPES